MRHRLNRGGDHALNRAIHTIATVRMRDCPTTQAYIARRTAEQRYAIDFNKINSGGFLAVGDRSKNESWPTYDQTVLAVADSDVVAAANDFPDQIPEAAKPVTIKEADGNYVMLHLAEGVYAFYAHLKPGTVAVHAVPACTAASPSPAPATPAAPPDRIRTSN